MYMEKVCMYSYMEIKNKPLQFDFKKQEYKENANSKEHNKVETCMPTFLVFLPRICMIHSITLSLLDGIQIFFNNQINLLLVMEKRCYIK